jgi:hypothetical protein
VHRDRIVEQKGRQFCSFAGRGADQRLSDLRLNEWRAGAALKDVPEDATIRELTRRSDDSF